MINKQMSEPEGTVASSLSPVSDNTPSVGTPGKAPKASSDETIAAPVSKPAGKTTPTAGV